MPWHVSAHTHAFYLVDYLQQQRQQHFPMPDRRSQKRHSFLTKETWDLHSEVVKIRRSCSACRCHIARHGLAAAFEAWKGAGCGPSFLERYFCRWFHRTQLACAAMGFRLTKLGSLLRKACSADRAAYLHACAQQVDAGKDKEAAEAVQQLLGHKRRKPFTPDALPALLTRSGEVCNTPHAMAQRWREHYGDLEAGLSATPQQLLAACSQLAQEHWPLLEIPSETVCPKRARLREQMGCLRSWVTGIPPN